MGTTKERKNTLSEFFNEADIDAKATADAEAADSDDYQFEKGETLKGIVLSAKAVDTKYGKKLVLIVRNVGDEKVGGIETGKSANLWCPTVLQRKMLEEAPKPGTGVILRYEGKVKPEKGGNDYHTYTVLVEQSAPEAYVALVAQLEQDSRPAAPAQDSSSWKF